ncbi:MAG: DNA polymerase I, partial [Acidimicrobiales bacterium]
KDELIIVTGDRDNYQLVADPYIRVLYNKRGVSDYALYDEAGILERTGVTPKQYADYAALRGDPSDNLDGVPGVGEKTAAKLINQYFSIDGVIAAAAEQTPKLAANLTEHGERVRRNAGMMVLRRDVPVSPDYSSLRPSPDMQAARRLFEFLEFRTMPKRLHDVATERGWELRGAPDVPAPDGDARGGGVPALRVEEPSADEAAQLVGGVGEAVLAAAWAGDPGRSALTGLAVVLDAATGRVAWVPVEGVVRGAVGAALASHAALVMHDAKPLMRSLLAEGIDLRGLVLDTQIAAYLVDPARGGFSLADVSRDHLGVAPEGSTEAGDQLDFGGSGESVASSCASAALVTAHLAPLMRSRLAAIDNTALYADIENPLVRVLARMEHLGIEVDVDALGAVRDRLQEEASRLTETLYAVAGRSFHLNSPAQLREILFDERGLTPGKKTKTGFSTDAATLERLRDEWPEFIEPLLRYREVEKLRSTYGEGLLAEVDRSDSRIHATFNQTVARTGRLSSDRPNLHNIPVRSDEGRVFRTAFVARDGCELMVADYNQIELRCIAHLAADPGLVAAFNAGEDIHRATAARVFGVDPAKVSADQRAKAKMVSYGLAYGMEAYGLSQRLAIPVPEAAEILDSYFAAFPNVRAYMDSAVHEARQRQYTETLFKRRRPIPELLSDNFRIRQAGERQAMNAAIQGLAADIFKIALVRIDRRLETEGLTARLVLQVHDEVLVESPLSEHDAVNEAVLAEMRGAAQLSVPLEVNAAWDRTWADAKS